MNGIAPFSRLSEGVANDVFLVLDEQPKAATLLGGAIILTAVIGKGVLDARPANEHVVEPGPGSIA
jgi:hypothetical protein